MDKKTKILIVDDSGMFRMVIENVLREEKDMKVIGSVENGIEAISFLKSKIPDIITLDVEMPRMNGLETLLAINKLKTFQPGLKDTCIIMVSSATNPGAEITIKSLEAGAFDFLTKPSEKSKEKNHEYLRRNLTRIIRMFSTRRICSSLQKNIINREEQNLKNFQSVITPGFVPKVILIGISTGGPKALSSMLPVLSRKLKAKIPIFIVQHMPPNFTKFLAERLDSKCEHKVKEGEANELVQNNHIYIAPGGKHMILKKNSLGKAIIGLNEKPPVVGCRPSADLLFMSAPSVYGRNVIALIMTGMGNDGTEGLNMLKKAGAIIIAQDKQSSVVWGMPGSAVSDNLTDHILPLDKIPDGVCNFF